MTLQQLEYILAVNQYGTISEAAVKLNVSHPAISRSIINLEEELGVAIFIRERGGIKLTTEGQTVIECARHVNNEIANLQLSLNRAKELKKIIRLAVFPLDALYFIPSLVSQFKTLRPDYSVSITHTELSDVTDKVNNGAARFGIGLFTNKILNTIEKQFVVIPLKTSRFVIGCGKNYDCFKKDSISISEILEYPLILHNDSFILESLKDIFGDVNKIKVFMYSNDNNLIKQTVRRGLALSLHSAFLVNDGYANLQHNEEIKYIPIEGSTEKEKQSLKVTMALFYKNEYLTKPEKKLVELLLKII